MPTRLLLSLLIALVAGNVLAQPRVQADPYLGLPEAFVFDGFAYDRAERAPGGLFGANPWCRRVDEAMESLRPTTACAPEETDTLRFWYEWRYDEPSWLQKRGQIVEVTPASVLRLGFEDLSYPDPETGRLPHPAQIQSSLTATTGVWAARVNFSDLEAALGITQAFWTITHWSVVTNGYFVEGDSSRPWCATPGTTCLGPFPNGDRRFYRLAWGELDFEWQNHFNCHVNRFPCRRGGGPGPIPYLSTGLYEGRNDHDAYFQAHVFPYNVIPPAASWGIGQVGTSTPMHAGGHGAADPVGWYQCRYALPGPDPTDITDPEVVRVGDVETCASLLSGSLTAPAGDSFDALNDGVYAMLVVRSDGEFVRFSVVGSGWDDHEPGGGGGWFAMESPWLPGTAPTQAMMTVFDTQVTTPGDPTQPSVMEVDWFYYTPEFDRPSSHILRDVRALEVANPGQRYAVLPAAGRPTDPRLRVIDVAYLEQRDQPEVAWVRPLPEPLRSGPTEVVITAEDGFLNYLVEFRHTTTRRTGDGGLATHTTAWTRTEQGYRYTLDVPDDATEVVVEGRVTPLLWRQCRDDCARGDYETPAQPYQEPDQGGDGVADRWFELLTPSVARTQARR
ncbi:MAG: hypothetical protein AAF809_01035 [Bacteroidota bacterium]